MSFAKWPNLKTLFIKWAKSKVCTLTNIYNTVVGEFPAGLQPEDWEGGALLWAEVAEGGVRHVVGLQRELVERRQQLGDGADGLVGDVDAVGDAERDDARRQTGPQTSLRHLVAPAQRQLEQTLRNKNEDF